jgi:GR25 family glycosyltransferase involved in LPS biosynthesis
MRDEQIPAALVLEDDARVNPKLARLLQEGLEFDDWDYCFLDGDGHNEKGRIFYDAGSGREIGSGFRCYRLSDGPQTTHAYMITRQAALKRLEHAYPLVKAIDIYAHLPYEIRFWAVVSPKAAWVSEHSLESFTSKRNVSQDQLSLGWLRKWALFYKIKDMIKLRGLKDHLEVRRLKRQGVLADDCKWKAIPFDRQILLR